jgi:serine/threonine protein kinase
MYFSPCSAPGGDFQSVLDEDMVPFEEDVQGFLRQILEALEFIHERQIAHLDIKVSGLTRSRSYGFGIYNCNASVVVG